MSESAAGRGYVVVAVTIYPSGIPLEGAKVTLKRSAGENAGGVSYTGVDGLSEAFAVETPPRGSGGGGEYFVDVEKKGYGSVKNYKVNVYDGVTMRHPVHIVPLIDL